MTDHVTHLTAKTVRHIFGWTIISTVLGGIAAAMVTVVIRNHDYVSMGTAAILVALIIGTGLVSS